MNREKLSNLAGWLGIAAIQGSTMPAILGTILWSSAKLPPLSMVVPVWVGLLLFLYRGVERRDTVAIVSNLIGFVLNSILLGIVVYGGA